MADTKTPLLNLSTLSERYTVTIDGDEYELRNPGELDLLSYHKIGKASAEVEQLLADADALTTKQVTRMNRLIDQLCRAILDAPDVVHKGLKDIHRLQVIQVFNTLPESQPALSPGENGETAPEETKAPSTGESKSQG